MANWMDQGKQGINQFLFDLETEKAADIAKKRDEEAKKIKELMKLARDRDVNPYGFNKLRESNIWRRTEEEDVTLINFGERLKNYHARRDVQKQVISFATGPVRPYIELKFTSSEINEYVVKSQYWIKCTKYVKSHINEEKIKTVYAKNEEMESVIFRYLDKYVITTKSSLKNYFRTIRGDQLHTGFVNSGAPNAPTEPTQEHIAQPVRHMDVNRISSLLDKFNEEKQTDVQRMITELNADVKGLT